jgi:DNA-binding GntR family transcriptional regulator
MDALPPDTGPTLQQVPRGTRLVEAVVESLTAAILSEQFRAGDKLIETKLASQLGVSRGPVRDAFLRLERVGLVESRPYQGTFVAELSDQDIQELYAVRAPLEGMAARLLAESGDDQAIGRLQQIVDDMGQETVSSRLIELDVMFHAELFKLTGHRLLTEVWSLIEARLRKFLLLKRVRLYHTPQAACAIHGRVVEAIRSGDPDRAEQAAREHILAARRSADSIHDPSSAHDHTSTSPTGADNGAADPL